MTLPLPPVGAASGAAAAGAGTAAAALGSVTTGLATGFGGLAMAVSGSALRSRRESLSSPALVSNALWLSPAMSSPPGSVGLTLYGPGSALISSGGPLVPESLLPSQKKVAATI